MVNDLLVKNVHNSIVEGSRTRDRLQNWMDAMRELMRARGISDQEGKGMAFLLDAVELSTLTSRIDACKLKKYIVLILAWESYFTLAH